MTFMAYGLAVLIVMGLAWLSAEHVLQKLGFVLLFSWALTNCAVFNLGFHNAPGPIAVGAGVLALVTALLGYRNRSVPALLVVALYVVGIGLTVTAIVKGLTDTYTFWLTRNLIFSAQLAIVGGASGVAGLARIAASPRRFHHRGSVA